MQLTPFNDIWYIDCFRHGIAQIAHNFNFLPQLFENDYFEYVFTHVDGNPVLKIETRHFVPWYEIFEENGITVGVCSSSDGTCLDEIKGLLSTGAYIILPIDCFYEDIRPDTFKIKHMMHYLVIYGFDETSQEFLLLEHNYENDLRYKHKRISFDSAIEAHLAVPAFRKSNENSFFVFKEKGSAAIQRQSDIRQIYLGINSFLESRSELYSFVEEFCATPIPSDSEQAKEYALFYKKIFEDAYSAKKYQSYFYNYVLTLNNSDAVECFANVNSYSDWSIIIGMLGRCAYKNEFPADLHARIGKFLRRIVENESKWQEVLKYE